VTKAEDVYNGLRCAVCEYLFSDDTSLVTRCVRDTGEVVHQCCWTNPGECIHSLYDRTIVQ
jgi:hypothetical protein